MTYTYKSYCTRTHSLVDQPGVDLCARGSSTLESTAVLGTSHPQSCSIVRRYPIVCENPTSSQQVAVVSRVLVLHLKRTKSCSHKTYQSDQLDSVTILVECFVLVNLPQTRTSPAIIA